MKISLNWLRDFVDIKILDKKSLDHVVVGYVKSLKKHPDADGLQVAQVTIGDETVQIVCGGTNLVAKAYVPVAKIGAVLPGNFKIEKTKIRGIESHGMICAKEELKMGHDGARKIWHLDSKKKWIPGMPFVQALKLENTHSPQELAELLTLHTAEVEDVIKQDDYLNNVVTGRLITFDKMDSSDKLHVGQFDIGWKMVQIVFGSVYKINVGEILPLALPGAKLPGGDIKRTEIRGIKSEGMVCGDDEIGIENSPEGITRFPDDTPLGVPIAGILGMTDAILDIDNKSLTHRPDLWGHYGIAREFSAILKKPLKPLSDFTTAPLDLKKTPAKKFTIKINDEKACPNFDACVLENIRVTESPQWIKSRLQACGIRPINNLVDVTNYVMLELGQPMHAYDRKIVGGYGLTVRRAKKGEKLETIDHKKRALHKDDLIIASTKNEPLGLAGVMGGTKSEIRPDTTEVILEAATFDPVIVRQMSTRHGLRSDASQRFEKGQDEALTSIAIRRAIQLLKETCPNAECVTPLTGLTIGGQKPIEITLNPLDVISRVGTKIPTHEMIRILTALEFKVEKIGKTLKVTVPTHRATGDVFLPEDLIEEIARIYGYQNINPILPNLPIQLPHENEERLHKHAARAILAKELGLNEVVNYSFYNEALFHQCGLQDLRHIKVLNPLSSDQTHMRISLIPGLLQNLKKNSREYDHLKLFEIGRTYREIGEFMPLEEKWIAAAIGQNKMYEPFYEIKGTLEGFLKSFRTPSTKLHRCTTSPSYAHPKKCLEIHQRGKVIGHVFELHPGVAKAFELTHRIGLFELNFTALMTVGRDLPAFKPLPKYPSMSFDVSLLVDRKREVADIEKTIEHADPHRLIQSVELFDMYHGAGIPENKKSLTFNVKLRHEDHTLTDNEFQEAHTAVLKAVQKAGGEVRGKD